MKHITIIIAIITVFSCKAQSIIVPIGSGGSIEHNPNYYKKDVNNEFNKFEGTWKYQNATTEITIILKKEEHYLSPSNYYKDLLVGEYQYIENGIEKVNTLSDINNPAISGYQHKISGGVFKHQLPSFCIDNSNIAEIKIWLHIDHPTDEFAEGRIILRYVNDNGIEKIESCIYDKSTLSDNNKLDIPDGSYTFVKQ